MRTVARSAAHCVCNNEVHLCKIQITAGTRLVVSQRAIATVAKFMHLPRAQSDGIKSVDLKSPNELTEEESPAASRIRPSFSILRH